MTVTGLEEKIRRVLALTNEAYRLQDKGKLALAILLLREIIEGKEEER